MGDLNVEEVLGRVLREEVVEERTVRALCRGVQEVLLAESNMELVSSPVTLVGDIHGQFFDVQKLLALGRTSSRQGASHPPQSTSSSATSWTVGTTRWRPSCSSSA